MTLCPLACWLSQLCLFPTDHSDYFIGNQKNVKYLSKICLFFQLIHRWAAGEYYPYTPCSELAMAHICLALNSQSIMLSHNTNFKITAKIDKTNGGLSRTNSVHCRLLMYHPISVYDQTMQPCGYAVRAIAASLHDYILSSATSNLNHCHQLS